MAEPKPGEPIVLRLSFAFHDIDELNPRIRERHSSTLRELDLTSNKFSDLISLRDFTRLETLILDGNLVTSQTKLPKLPSLTTLWVNKNKIVNLSTFINKISDSVPNLKYLSMLGNEACPNFLNGGSPKQYQDYRHFVISRLPNLLHLDSAPITDQEREAARRKYPSEPTPTPTSSSSSSLASASSSSSLSSSSTIDKSDSSTGLSERPKKKKLKKAASTTSKVVEESLETTEPKTQREDTKPQKKGKKKKKGKVSKKTKKSNTEVETGEAVEKGMQQLAVDEPKSKSPEKREPSLEKAKEDGPNLSFLPDLSQLESAKKEAKKAARAAARAKAAQQAYDSSDRKSVV